MKSTSRPANSLLMRNRKGTGEIDRERERERERKRERHRERERDHMHVTSPLQQIGQKIQNLPMIRRTSHQCPTPHIAGTDVDGMLLSP